MKESAIRGRAAAAVTLVLVTAVGAVACARPVDHVATAPLPGPLGTAGVAPGAPRVAWSQKTFEQRMEFMGLTFHPRMKELFSEYDATAYGKLRCQTCHGEDMEARRFSMPATLRALPADAPVDAARARDPKATSFMEAKVLPLTAELLSHDDPGTASRLGCGSCHPAQ